MDPSRCEVLHSASANRCRLSSLSVSNILICDDHPISQMGIQYSMLDLFPKSEFQFTKVTLGREAVSLSVSKPFDLLTLDLRLPDISGIEVVKRLREATRDGEKPSRTNHGENRFAPPFRHFGMVL